MAILKPDNTTTLCGVTVNEFLLTKHDPNHNDMHSVSLDCSQNLLVINARIHL